MLETLRLVDDWLETIGCIMFVSIAELIPLPMTAASCLQESCRSDQGVRQCTRQMLWCTMLLPVLQEDSLIWGVGLLFIFCLAALLSTEPSAAATVEAIGSSEVLEHRRLCSAPGRPAPSPHPRGASMRCCTHSGGLSNFRRSKAFATRVFGVWGVAALPGCLGCVLVQGPLRLNSVACSSMRKQKYTLQCRCVVCGAYLLCLILLWTLVAKGRPDAALAN